MQRARIAPYPVRIASEGRYIKTNALQRNEKRTIYVLESNGIVRIGDPIYASSVLPAAIGNR